MTARAALLTWSAGDPATPACLRLAKPGIAALATFSAAAASSLAPQPLSGRVWLALAGLFLLAAGSGALNQYQERGLDARMPRTRRRPLPAGEVRPRQALLFAAALLACGLTLLQRGGGTAAALLGVAAAAWYNGVYTGLKRRTALAFLPGALVGAIPPAIGWAAAGGSLADPRLAALCALLLLWQVPHFGLLLLAHGDEYAGAGLPSVSSALPRRRLARLVGGSMLAAAAAGLLLPLPAPAGWERGAIAAASALLAAGAVRVASADPAAVRRAFHAVNGYLVLVLALAMVAAARAPHLVQP